MLFGTALDGATFSEFPVNYAIGVVTNSAKAMLLKECLIAKHDNTCALLNHFCCFEFLNVFASTEFGKN